MNKPKRKKSFNTDYEKRVMPVSLIDADTSIEAYSKKDLRTRAAYFVLNGVPEFSVNAQIPQNYSTQVEAAIHHLVNLYLQSPTPTSLWAFISTRTM